MTVEQVLIQMALQLGGMAALSMVLDHPGAKSDWGIPLDIYSRYTKAKELLAEQGTVIVLYVSCTEWWLTDRGW